MRTAFAQAVLGRELECGRIRRDGSVLAVCAGQSDADLFAGLGFTRVTLSNVDLVSGALHGGAACTEGWERADAQALPFPDRSFDVAFVSDGLHHCRSPHRAVTEMYRVARRGIVVVESRDSFAMRAARRLRLTWAYEFNDRLLATREHGGVDFGPVPNFVYRWTERDFEKLIRTFDPEHDQRFGYYYGLDLPARVRRVPPARWAAAGLTRLAPRQGNTFAMLAYRAAEKRYLSAGRLLDGVSSPGVQRYRDVQRRRERV